MGDKTIIAETLRSDEKDFEFVKKDSSIFYPDSNTTASYQTGQIMWDLSNMAGQTDYSSFREGHMVIPLVVNLSSATGGNGLTADFANAFAVSLKNSYASIIDSYTLTINGKTVKELTRFENMDVIYRIHSSFSKDDELNYGASIGYAKDTGSFEYYSDVTNPNKGIGECANCWLNNTNAHPSVAFGYNGANSNEFYADGRWKRMQTTSFTNTTALANSASIMKSQGNLTTENRNYCYNPNGEIEVIWYMTAYIPLKLFPIFKELPLMRGARVQLTVYTNTNCYATFGNLGGGNVGFSSCAITTQNAQFPLQISPPQLVTVGQSGTGFNNITTANTQYNVGIAIAKSHSTAKAGYSHPISNCRLYIPTYQPSPSMALKLSENGGLLRNVVYNDLMFTQYNSITAGQNFTWALPFFITRPRYILILPFISANTNGMSALNTQIPSITNTINIGSPVQSPFTSSPSLCSAYLTLTNFNVSLNNKMLYSQNVNYNFQMFNNEVRTSNLINGGVSDYGISNSLFSEEDFNSKGYNYIYVNLDRTGSQAQDNQLTQIQITGTNNSAVSCDYYVFCAYSKSFTLNVSTGQTSQ